MDSNLNRNVPSSHLFGQMGKESALISSFVLSQIQKHKGDAEILQKFRTQAQEYKTRLRRNRSEHHQGNLLKQLVPQSSSIHQFPKKIQTPTDFKQQDVQLVRTKNSKTLLENREPRNIKGEKTFLRIEKYKKNHNYINNQVDHRNYESKLDRKKIKRSIGQKGRSQVQKYQAEQFARMDKILSSMDEKIQQNKELIERNMSFLHREVNLNTLLKKSKKKKEEKKIVMRNTPYEFKNSFSLQKPKIKYNIQTLAVRKQGKENHFLEM